MQAIILAGGFATRLSGVTDTPKCLADIGGGKTVLDHQVELLQKGGVRDITLSLHHGADAIRNYAGRFGDGVRTVHEPEPLGTGGAIKFAAQGARGPVVALNGDILSDVDIAALIAKAVSARAQTLALVPWSAKDFGNVELLGDRIIGFHEKTGNDIPQWVSLGAYVLFPGIFEHFPDKFSIERECFPSLARRGMLRAHFHRGKFLDVGTPERFEKRRDVLGR